MRLGVLSQPWLHWGMSDQLCTICGNRAEFEVDRLDAFSQRAGEIQSACATDLGIVIVGMREASYRETGVTFVVDAL